VEIPLAILAAMEVRERHLALLVRQLPVVVAVAAVQTVLRILEERQAEVVEQVVVLLLELLGRLTQAVAAVAGLFHSTVQRAAPVL
jgi:hypothetical protein